MGSLLCGDLLSAVLQASLELNIEAKKTMEANGSTSFATAAVTAAVIATMKKNLTDTTTDSHLHCEPLVSMKLAESKLLGTMACAVCYCPLIERMTSPSSLECSTCKKVYPCKEDFYWDLTVGSGCTGYSESTTPFANIFRTALVSYLYERGWRQLFALAGFPGPNKEFEHAKDYLKPAIGGIIIDASCGTGPFARLFIKEQTVFSTNMLKHCNKFMKEEMISDKQLMMVKADISRLPFTTNSIDAVHAGAALHCWPSPANAVAEISRVLRPGGILVASTFLIDVVPLAIPALRIGRKYVSQYHGYKTFLSEDELEGLCKACGLVDFKCVRKGLYVMLSATKEA
uniref:Methyltransferase type 11 domain-containing protein n=1 Tax=Leersia perrieri TaxID=77586 RepID=A0A0D9VER0_9ORYZ